MSEDHLILYCVDDSGDHRKRSANMMPAERLLLAELFLKYKSTLSNKKIDAVSVRSKEQAWQSLAVEFQERSTSGIHREWLQLKRAYENMRSRSKKTPLYAKVKRRKTEGDISISHVEGMDEKLLALLGNEANVMVKVCDEVTDESFDGDSEIYLTSPNEHEIVMPDETFIDTSTQAPIAAIVSPTSTAVEQVDDLQSVINNNVLQTQTRSKAADRVTNQQPSITKKVQDIRPKTVQQRIVNGQLEELKGTLPLPTSGSRASQDCSELKSKSCNKNTDKVKAVQQSESDSSKDDYYRIMLDMRRTEHEKRMRVLSLKEWYYSKKILKLNVEELRNGR